MQRLRLLPHIQFSIMFALSLKPSHGYEIMQKVGEDSNGFVVLGPGALYGSLKKLNEQNYIEDVPSIEPSDRRRYYRLTKKGWDKLASDGTYYKSITRLAKTRHISVN